MIGWHGYLFPNDLLVGLALKMANIPNLLQKYVSEYVYVCVWSVQCALLKCFKNFS